MLRSHKKMVLLTLLLPFLSLILEAAASPAAKSSDPNKPPAVYRRYVRRRPPVYADDEFMEEVIEEFYVQHRPPKFALSDDDIDLIIKCDLNPEYKDCYKLKSKDEHPMHVRPETEKPRTTPPLEDFPLLPDLPKDGEEETTTDYPWSTEELSATEADPKFSEGSGHEVDNTEEYEDEWR